MDEQTTPASDNNTSSMLGSLLSNPELLQSIGSLIGSTSDSAKETASPAADGLAKALSDPALMAKLPQVMAMLQPMLANASGESADSASAENTDAVPAGAIHYPSKRHHTDCRDDLLLALKPFLSPSRCEAVATIIRLSKLGTVLKHLQ